MKSIFVCALAVMALTVGCGGEDGTVRLAINWQFPSGDCASYGVWRVRVTITPEAGEKKTSEFACGVGRGDMGLFRPGTYGILAEGLNGTGKVVAQNLGTAVTFGESGLSGDLPVGMLRTADMVVTWKMSNGGNCPPDVQLPYFITIYRPPGTVGGAITEKVREIQESCATGSATLVSFVPGRYIIELDSRAETPKVMGTKDVWLKEGEKAQFAFQF